MKTFTQRVLEIVRSIPRGEVLTYAQVAQRSGSPGATRAVGSIMQKNGNPTIPCHRVIRSNGNPGEYNRGGELVKRDILRGEGVRDILHPEFFNFSKQVDIEHMGSILQMGAVGVIPTDTIYGIVASTLDIVAINRLYEVRMRNKVKPCIVLIASLQQLSLFGIQLSKNQKDFLDMVWPGPISIILPTRKKNLEHIHRGTGKISFRIPKNKKLLQLIQISGPILAPSANTEGGNPSENLYQAKKYFDRQVDFYCDGGKLCGYPSTLIEMDDEDILIVREGRYSKEAVQLVAGKSGMLCKF